MSLSEPDRHELYEWFRESAGMERAETMMNLLPPTGWGDVATRRDLELLEMRLRAQFEGRFGGMHSEFDGLRSEFDGLRVEFAELRADIADRLRVQTIAMSTLFLGGMGLSVGLSRLLG